MYLAISPTSRNFDWIPSNDFIISLFFSRSKTNPQMLIAPGATLITIPCETCKPDNTHSTPQSRYVQGLQSLRMTSQYQEGECMPGRSEGPVM